jgi:23S rRNA G2445 N2-methylase RlmL
MIHQYFERIENNLDVRQNLIELRKILKTDAGREAFRSQTAHYLEVLTALLQHEDAKVRKNAALILGETGLKQVLTPLYEAYEKEKQLFVRSAYLTAMRQLDYRDYLEQLKTRMQDLMQTAMTAENQKHLTEELKLLREMVMTLETPTKHPFTGYAIPSEVILLTSPGFEELTVQALPVQMQKDARVMNGAVRVLTDRIRMLTEIRTVKGILFRFCKNPLPANDYESVADAIVKAGILSYLQKRHEGGAPFYFRIDMKTKLVLNEKSQYVKRLGARLEQLTDHKLRNSASNYEFELRIMENKKGDYSVYLILHTLPDTRFAYRRHALATSMHPVRAAEITALAREYMAEDAYVFDPFCGTGTLLIERQKLVHAKGLYGVDLYGKAIELGRENAELAHVPINFINRDFVDFKHDYLFDEILTELPAQSDKMTPAMLDRLYQQFIRKIPEWLCASGYVIVCTTEEALLGSLAKRSGYLKTEAIFHLSGKRETALMIFKYQ